MRVEAYVDFFLQHREWKERVEIAGAKATELERIARIDGDGMSACPPSSLSAQGGLASPNEASVSPSDAAVDAEAADSKAPAATAGGAERTAYGGAEAEKADGPEATLSQDSPPSLLNKFTAPPAGVLGGEYDNGDTRTAEGRASMPVAASTPDFTLRNAADHHGSNKGLADTPSRLRFVQEPRPFKSNCGPRVWVRGLQISQTPHRNGSTLAVEAGRLRHQLHADVFPLLEAWFDRCVQKKDVRGAGVVVAHIALLFQNVAEESLDTCAVKWLLAAQVWGCGHIRCAPVTA